MSGIFHEWNGTILTITSDSGTSSCDLKGDKGDDGCRGAQGVAGKDGKDADTSAIEIDTSNFYTKDAPPTAEEVGASPSGYGLGEYIGGYDVLADANNATLSGWYRVASTTKNYGLSYGVMRVEALSSSRMIQTAITVADGKEYRRSCIDGVWSEWKPLVEAIGAKPADWLPAPEEIGAKPADWMPTAEEVGAIGFIGNITDYDSDFNNCLEEGYYQINNSSGVNAPASGFGMLLVMHQDYITQMAFLRSGAVWSRCETTVERLIATSWTRVDAGASAPAGYGLGTYGAPKWISNISEIDGIKINGMYGVSQDIGSPLVLEGIAFNMLHLEVYMVNTLWGTQLVRFLDGYVMQRRCRNGSWEPWEWINPPMIQGKEYRLLEKLNDSPVYAKLINIGYLASGTHSVAHNCAVSLPVSLDFYNNNQELLNGYSNITNLTVDRTSIHIACGNAFGNITVLMKYTKAGG